MLFGNLIYCILVTSDEQAIELMNDSKYGLTASVWTNDRAAGLEIGKRLEQLVH